MRLVSLLVTLVGSALVAGDAIAQVPSLPEGARTRWVVGQPYEIVAYVTSIPPQCSTDFHLHCDSSR